MFILSIFYNIFSSYLKPYKVPYKTSHYFKVIEHARRQIIHVIIISLKICIVFELKILQLISHLLYILSVYLSICLYHNAPKFRRTFFQIGTINAMNLHHYHYVQHVLGTKSMCDWYILWINLFIKMKQNLPRNRI